MTSEKQEDKLIYDAINLKMIEIDNTMLTNPEFNGFYNCFFLLSAWKNKELTKEETKERINLLMQYNNININQIYKKVKKENPDLGKKEIQRIIKIKLDKKNSKIYPRLKALMEQDRKLITDFLKTSEPIKKRDEEVTVIPPQGAIAVRTWKSN